jgi:flagellar basal-body rod modification protein FlgD
MADVSFRPKGLMSDIKADDNFFVKRGNHKKLNDNVEDRIKEQKQQFFTLLTAQLKAQDPTEPMDTGQMTQQIFSINMVEQQLETNKQLKQAVMSLEKSRFLESANYIGKKFIYSGNKVDVKGGKGLVEFEVLGKPENVKVQVYDKFGILKETINRPLEEGIHSFMTDFKGRKLSDGTYTYQVIAKDKDDNDLKIRKFSSGRVLGVIPSGDEYVFEVNGEEIPLSGVMRISKGDEEASILDELKSIRDNIEAAVNLNNAPKTNNAPKINDIKVNDIERTVSPQSYLPESLSPADGADALNNSFHSLNQITTALEELSR